MSSQDIIPPNNSRATSNEPPSSLRPRNRNADDPLSNIINDFTSVADGERTIQGATTTMNPSSDNGSPLSTTTPVVRSVRNRYHPLPQSLSSIEQEYIALHSSHETSSPSETAQHKNNDTIFKIIDSAFDVLNEDVLNEDEGRQHTAP